MLPSFCNCRFHHLKQETVHRRKGRKAHAQLIQNRARGIGSCADIGHWNRQGLDEMECLRRVGDRLITFHFKDIAPKREGEAEQTDVIWGTGCLKLKQILQHLRDMKWKGYLAVEYEANWLNSVPDIRKSLQYFESLSEEVLK